MIVECGYCGAPLDVREGSRFTRCGYCKKTSERDRLKTIDVQTPKNWRPPPVWRPPAHVPADSNVPLQYRGSAAGAAIVAFVLLAVGGVVAIGVASAHRKGGVTATASPDGKKAVDTSFLARITMRESAAELAKLTGVALDAQKSIRVPLAHPNWDSVTFRYDEKHLDHVREFFLNAQTPSTDARKKLMAQLQTRWDKDGYRWESCSVYAPEKGNFLSTNITIDVHSKETTENPLWRKQAETLWKVVRKAAFNVGEPATPAELRDNIGLGYTLGDMAKVDLDADIDHADQAVKDVYPGAVRNLFIDLEYHIALDHPLFSNAELNWANKKGARMKELELRPVVSANNKWPKRQILDDCVTAVFGTPDRVNEGDHLAGSKDITWKPAAGGYIRVYDHMIVVWLRDNPFGKPMPKDVWLKTLAMFESCGR